MASTTYKVEPIPSSPISILGEGPHWDAASQSLYYNDIYGNVASILRYDYRENKTYSAVVGKISHLHTNTSPLTTNYVGRYPQNIDSSIIFFSIFCTITEGEPVISFIIPVEGTTDQFAIGIGRRVGIVQWDGKSPKAKVVRIALEVEKDPAYKFNRFNDAKSDPKGRFYGGTMRLEECGDIFEVANGTLYKYAKDENVTTLRKDVAISNGLAWNTTTNKFYYIDSCQLDVKEFDYDPKTGNLCKRFEDTV